MEDVRTEDVVDDVEQQKNEMSAPWPRRMVAAIGLFSLYSFIVLNEGAIRAAGEASLAPGASWTGGDRIPQIVMLLSALGEMLFGLTGLLVGLALLLQKAGSKTITMIWMGIAFVFGWFVFIVFVLAAPIYDLVNNTEVPMTALPGTSLAQFDTLRAMGLIGGITWCFALQGGQFMVGNIIYKFQAQGEAKGASYAKSRMIMWSVNATIAGLAFLIAGAVQLSVASGPYAAPQAYPPIFMTYPELSITAGVLTILFGIFATGAAVTGAMINLVPAAAMFIWVANLTMIVWGQVWLPRLQIPTTILAGLSFMVFTNVAYSATEYEEDIGKRSA